MNQALRALAAVGDLADRAAAGLAAAGRELPAAARALPVLGRLAWAAPRYRWIGIASGLAMLLLYLAAIGDISGGRGGGTFRLAPDWVDRLTETRAPWLFEPVAAWRPGPWLEVFVSPGNLSLGGLLAALLGLNVALTAYQVFAVRACRRTAFGRILAALPAFGVGMACCAPTLLLALGTGVAAAVMPVFLPLRSWLFPASVLLMAGMLLWTAHRPRRPASQADLAAGLRPVPGEPEGVDREVRGSAAAQRPVRGVPQRGAPGAGLGVNESVAVPGKANRTAVEHRDRADFVARGGRAPSGGAVRAR